MIALCMLKPLNWKGHKAMYNKHGTNTEPHNVSNNQQQQNWPAGLSPPWLETLNTVKVYIEHSENAFLFSCMVGCIYIKIIISIKKKLKYVLKI